MRISLFHSWFGPVLLLGGFGWIYQCRSLDMVVFFCVAFYSFYSDGVPKAIFENKRLAHRQSIRMIRRSRSNVGLYL